MNWSHLALLGALLPLPFLMLMFLVPETPRWYISKGKTKMARKSLVWLRGKGTDVTDELNAIEKTHVDSEKGDSQGAIFELFRGVYLRPLMICLGLMFFQQFSGINAVIFYTTNLFKVSCLDVHFEKHFFLRNLKTLKRHLYKQNLMFYFVLSGDW